MDMKIGKVLPTHLHAAALIRKGWTRSTFARDADGEACDPISPRAQCWCLAGALLRASYYNHDGDTHAYHGEEFMHGLRGKIKERAVDDLGSVYNGRVSLPIYNDMAGMTMEEMASTLEAL